MDVISMLNRLSEDEKIIKSNSPSVKFNMSISQGVKIKK